MSTVTGFGAPPSSRPASPAGEPPRRVAVVVVHGVADQQPGDSNRAIANLLLNIDEAAEPAYTAFVEQSVRIPVRKLPAPMRQEHADRSFASYAAGLRPAGHGKGNGRINGNGHGKTAASAPAPDAGIAFTASLTANYEPAGPEETYDTTVLRGARRARIAGACRDVDVYEMFWADLSRLTQGWVRMFAEAYQIMFHLASLGVHAINAGMAAEVGVGRARTWARWALSQRTAANMLVTYILTLNLWLAGLLVVLFATWPEEHVARGLAWGAYGLLAVVLVSVLSYRRYETTGSVGLAIGLSVAVAAAFGLAASLVPSSEFISQRALATLLFVGVAAGIAFILKAYDRYRPGAYKNGFWLGAPLAAWVLTEMWIAPSGREGYAAIRSAVAHGGELVYLAARFCWVIFLVYAWIAHRAGTSVVSQATGAAAERLKRLNWTARLTLSLPAVLFLLVTVGLWAALALAVPDRLFGHDHAPLGSTVLILGSTSPGTTVGSLVTALTADALGPGLGVLAFLVGLALVMVLYGMAPSVIAEVRPPGEPVDGSRSGRWLDAGFLAARWAGRLVVVGVLVVLPGFFILDLTLELLGRDWYPAVHTVNNWTLVSVGSALGASGAGLVMFGARLKQITLGLRGLVDVLLDVDNYLREHPRTSTPRARIMTRMASLLRHVYGQGYDSVVIIAHSQGSVIAADLLRYIHLQQLGRFDSGLSAHEGKPLYFFTMGSPLRQLYALRFPHLYHWARHAVPGPWSNRTQPIQRTTPPDPDELGLTQWVNAYRSGDYVGRYLWRPEDCGFAFETPVVNARTPWSAGEFPAIVSESAAPANRREFCIGAGGHTHYWDGTAPQVALELDRLITH